MNTMLHGSLRVGFTILIFSAFIPTAIAYQKLNPVASARTPVIQAETASSSEKSSDTSAEKPARCYLSLHLEMVGAPFASRVADAPAGLAHACDAQQERQGERKMEH